MSNKTLILCVDDEPVNLTIMEEFLQDSYEVFTAKSGEICLQQVGLQKPEIILLDVNMPEMDGLETCQRLKLDPDTADIPIIFVSALASNAELMAGYEAGGDDYITRPFSEEILRKKIQVVLACQRSKQQLKNISVTAVEALANNLSYIEELDMVVKFLHGCQAAQTLDEIAKKLFDCLRDFGLDGSLLILVEPENRVWFSDDIDRPMESQILESLRGQDRVLSFGTRIAINSDYATVLVRNLPSGQARRERLRLHLSIMIEGIDARLLCLESKTLLDLHRQILMRTLDAVQSRQDQADALRGQRELDAGEVLEAMGSDLDKPFSGLNLSRHQLAKLKNIIGLATTRIKSVYNDDSKSEEALGVIIAELSGALEEWRQERG